jgi:hypothetical protein
LILLLLFGVATAFDPYGPFESDTGKWIMSDENLGGPWYHTGHGITIGDGQNASITYNGTSKMLTADGADFHVVKNETITGTANFSDTVTLHHGLIVTNASPAVFDSEIQANGGITGTFSGTASRIAVGNFVDSSYGLKNSTANKVQINLTPIGGLAFGTGALLGSLGVESYHGLKSDGNGLQVNLTANKGLEFGTGTAEGSLQIKNGNGVGVDSGGITVVAEDPSLVVSASGVKVGASAFHLTTIAGGTVGDLALSNIAVGDELEGVLYVAKTAGNLTAISDIKAECTIGAGKITTVSTNTADGYLIVAWLDRTA